MIDEIKARLAAATSAPWYLHNTDDEMFMNVFVVTNTPIEPDMDLDERTNDHATVVAITLLQTPRVACIADDKWEQNADFIAHAPADIAYLLEQRDQIRKLATHIEHKIDQAMNYQRVGALDAALVSARRLLDVLGDAS